MIIMAFIMVFAPLFSLLLTPLRGVSLGGAGDLLNALVDVFQFVSYILPMGRIAFMFLFYIAFINARVIVGFMLKFLRIIRG